ncbi:hypothetical protein F4677DRAFT_209953 [Hypoxylon crocopeplum]|nr:hypothetical protein F4677DRAFT_209953 [Hypoxylon crocopeplum]
MPKTKAHMRSSRRIPSLKDGEIDHEISNNIDHSPSNQPLISSESNAPSMQSLKADAPQPNGSDIEAGPSGERDTSTASAKDGEATAGKKPASNENGATGRSSSSKRRSRASKEPETAIDILYENQRGGFLCGIPLFSSAALGNLDPPPWTNFAHRPSPTDINTAQVPDPSWEWAWPEWRINHDETIQSDSDGWEYSFMFSKKFSWHGPKWYCSFVRRRTWIRRRIKKGIGYQPNDPHMTGSEYFSVTSAKKDVERASIGQQTAGASLETPRRSRDTRRGDEDETEAQVDITTVDELMTVMRRSRIDREKLEAVENYIEHCSNDLHDLQEFMHEIMSLFIFQASRKLLLARLIQLHDDQAGEENKGKSPATQQKAENLAEAIKHADEEVRRLEYWSDIKGMAESGESRGAVDCGKGWDGGWEGLDKSGPKGIKGEGELP